MKTMGDVVAAPVEEDSFEEINYHSSSSGKELGHRTLKSLKRGLGKLWRRHRGNVSITEYDPCYKVAYLGNVLTGWAKGEGCVEKPVSTLWRNYVSSNRPDVMMRLTVTNGGLTATTKDHGLTEYWAHRVTYCTAPVSYPRLFVWVYRHEGRRLRPELRCHAALCSKESTARRLASTLNARLQQALLEFRRDKVSKQNARLSLANAVYENPSLPRRKILLSTGGQNYRPPLERSKSAPKLSAIEEDAVAEEIEQKRLLEELRSLENVARSWQDQDGWRLARLVDALNRAGAASEYLDENGSISSGCDTASTSNSEERASGADDNHATVENESRTGRRVLFASDVIRTTTTSGVGSRRNSEGSPNFMTCTGSPRFHCLRGTRKRYSSCRSDIDETEEEIEQEMDTSHVFDFEDAEIFNEVVDYRPHGESPSRIENLSRRRMDIKGEKYPTIMNQTHELIEGEESFLTLDSLDEEEADSDESGYVEAPPTSLLDRGKTDKPHANDEQDNSSQGANQQSPESNNQNGKDKAQKPNDTMTINSQRCLKERDNVDFIKCPISETIKKLANASLRSSKSLDIPTNSCLKVINTLKNSKSFDETRATGIDYDGESPSLHQRKQLLAQQGVRV